MRGPELGSTRLRPVELPRPATELDTVTADIVDSASKSGMELWRRGSASWPRLQWMCCRFYRYCQCLLDIYLVRDLVLVARTGCCQGESSSALA